MAHYAITDFGAIGDGTTLNTDAIAAAIEQCASAGGGTVVVPAGRFLTGPVRLQSRITLYLEAGAVLLFSDDFSHYPPVWTRWSGYECHGFTPLLFGSGLTQVSVKGEGCLDGQGHAWWAVNQRLRRGERYRSPQTDLLAKLNEQLIHAVATNIVEWDSQFLRPPLLQFLDCRHVKIEGVTLRNSPFWNTHLVYCQDVQVRGVRFQNPSDTPNGDGLDIDSCTNVRVSDCCFDVGDDCLCLKSGINEDGRRVGRPTENVTVTNCTMLHGHGGIVFGSENSGGIRNVTVSNCQFIGTDRGIRIKTNRMRGGYIRHLLLNNIYMEDVLCPLAINAFYRHGVDESDPLIIAEEAVPVTEKTPIVEHVRISNVTATGCRAAAGFIYGLPEMPIRDVVLSDVSIAMSRDAAEAGGEPDMVRPTLVMAGAGIYAQYAEGLELYRVQVDTRQGPALTLKETANTAIHHLSMKRLHPDTPVVAAERAKEVHIEGRQAAQHPRYLLERE
ncbi:glycoside hydrolase family 28 protein [Xylanibacillus composti]|uniref:Endopolygalacturonase n=1 Tax=Xylanibacillus composti TaxID=1572762 RepID=A0A8J4M380_9BACL|nr:glycoside hydrolase family 28 protein [Xylanibacillus composti]MDT9726358.1 glycoside hydrolase family 28 protein [Xylanibacillus composti]GIQ70534.1 endopolygalacturonase [Xylanibacillus composti]